MSFEMVLLFKKLETKSFTFYNKKRQKIVIIKQLSITKKYVKINKNCPHYL